jgi:hypothetical protein
LDRCPTFALSESTDEIQNDILKMNIDAMRKMQDVMNDLNTTVDSLNAKVGHLSKDVEEVREPTNVEKLTRKKEDSHPYYYGLNDMWNGSDFKARLDQVGDEAIIKLSDGTYIADFDDLPKHSDKEIVDSLKKF